MWVLLVLLLCSSSNAHPIGRRPIKGQRNLQTRQKQIRVVDNMAASKLKACDTDTDRCGGASGEEFPPPPASPTPPPTPPTPTDAPTPPPTDEPTPPPTPPPTDEPTRPPTKPPTNEPTPPPSNEPTRSPTAPPTPSPTNAPTKPPSPAPTNAPTKPPSPEPTRAPTSQPIDPVRITYQPGDFSESRISSDGNLALSNGLSAKPIAKTGKKVNFHNGEKSDERFHVHPDGAAVFEKPNGDGYYYASNAENETMGREWHNGGVGSIEFDADGNVMGYQRVASHLRMNCGGGATPWGSWLTCEEADHGKVWQIDPAGIKPKVRTEMGKSGHYESVAFDPETIQFYVTRDSDRGALTRFTPNARGYECYNQPEAYDRWCTLEHGTLEYLVISGGEEGTFRWVDEESKGRDNAELYYPNSEGIDVYDGMLYTTSKKLRRLLILNLRTGEYSYQGTENGAFDHQPDQVARIVTEDMEKGEESILYFCEDGGRNMQSPGVFGRNSDGRYFTIIHGLFALADETTGLAYSPDGSHMYVSYQKNGIIYDVWRDDGLPFHGSMLDIKYHTTQDDD